MNCVGISRRYSYEQFLFPVKCNQFKSCQNDNMFRAATQTAREVCHSKVKCSKREVTKAAREIYQKLNQSFEKTCHVSLAEALISVPELQLQQKKSKAEMKRERREQYRKSKQRIEEEWKETAIVRLVRIKYKHKIIHNGNEQSPSV